ncbi:MAG: RidA family protein [Prevotellaceae bacterium]|nr:RidA family protein [Prevotellaceae bacterium]
MKKIINTSNAPAAIGPYSQAVEANGMLFISGQLPVNPAAGKIETTTAIAQTEQVFANIKAILDEAGYTFSDVVKSTVFLSDIADFAAMNEVYKKYYQTECPARSAFAVKSLPLGALVEIETIACKNNG